MGRPMRNLSVLPGLMAVCILAGSGQASADKLAGVYPTCTEPETVRKAGEAAWRSEWAALRTMNCSLKGDRGRSVRVVRCAAGVTPRDMERFSYPVPVDESLPDEVCAVEIIEGDGSSGTYYTYVLNIDKTPSAAIPKAALAQNLRGIWPTCWEPGEVEIADAAANRNDWDAFRKMKCGLGGDSRTPVRVIRCAADVTPAKMEQHFDPVPRDASLPDWVCEVEAFEDDGNSGIYYTYFINIERTP